jgi:hypothetical protein
MTSKRLFAVTARIACALTLISLVGCSSVNPNVEVKMPGYVRAAYRKLFALEDLHGSALPSRVPGDYFHDRLPIIKMSDLYLFEALREFQTTVNEHTSKLPVEKRGAEARVLLDSAFANTGVCESVIETYRLDRPYLSDCVHTGRYRASAYWHWRNDPRSAVAR